MEKKNHDRNYYTPDCIIIQVNETTNLMDASFHGQHNSATDGGTLHSESEGEEAKHTLLWQDIDEETETWENK